MKTADDIARAFGCPLRLAAMLAATPCPPELTGIMTLGPVRVHWVGDAKGGKPIPSCWSLDGKRATFEQIAAAARLAP